MDRQSAVTGAASLERIASALERISGSLDGLSACGVEHAAFHNPSTGAAVGAIWRRRTVTSGNMEPPSSPFRPFRILDGLPLLQRLAIGATNRRSRPWLGLGGVGLATTATILAGDAWLLPALALCAWWWSPTEWSWTWLVPLFRGGIGVLWVSVGVGLFALLPLPVAGLVWIALAAGPAYFGVIAGDRNAVPECDP